MAYVEAVVARWGFDTAPEGPFGVTLLEGCWGLMCAKRQEQRKQPKRVLWKSLHDDMCYKYG